MAIVDLGQFLASFLCRKGLRPQPVTTAIHAPASDNLSLAAKGGVSLKHVQCEFSSYRWVNRLVGFTGLLDQNAVDIAKTRPLFVDPGSAAISFDRCVIFEERDGGTVFLAVRPLTTLIMACPGGVMIWPKLCHPIRLIFFARRV